MGRGGGMEALTLSDALAVLEGVKRSTGGQYVARCPAHSDRNPSLSVTEGDTQELLVHCHAGCTPESILREIRRKAGKEVVQAALGFTRMTFQDVMSPEAWESRQRERREAREAAGNGKGPDKESPPMRVVARYEYHDEEGNTLYTRVRREDGQGNKTFFYEPSGIKRENRVLYRLPEVLEALSLGKTVCITEGEKDADLLVAHGSIATTAGGVNDWQGSFSELFQEGDRVCVFPDYDPPGLAFAGDLVNDLQARGVVVSVARYADPTLKDVSDHVSAGHKLGEITFGETVNPIDPEPSTIEPDTEKPLSHPGDILTQDPTQDADGQPDPEDEAQRRRREADRIERELYVRTIGGQRFTDLAHLGKHPELDVPPEAIVPGVVYRGRTTLFSGREKGGKSSILGYVVAQASAAGAKILYYGYEEALYDVYRRIARYRDAVLENIWLTDLVDLQSPPKRSLFEPWRELMPDLVVVDSLRAMTTRFYPAGTVTENDSEYANLVQEITDVSHRSGTAALLLHHAAKHGGYRGSTAIGGAVDNLLSLDYDPDKNQGDPTRAMTFVGRMGNGVKAPTLIYDVVKDIYKLDSAERGGFNVMVNDVLMAVVNDPGISIRGLRKAVKGRLVYIDESVRSLADEGKIIVREGARGALEHYPAGWEFEDDDPES